MRMSEYAPRPITADSLKLNCWPARAPLVMVRLGMIAAVELVADRGSMLQLAQRRPAPALAVSE